MRWPRISIARVSQGRSTQVPQRGWLTPTGYNLSEELVAISPMGAGAASVASLAAEIIVQHLHNGRRGLALCGAAQGAGVTFLTANVGIALAQAGISTLIVDTNFAAPRLQDLFQPPADPVGLRDLLADPSVTLSQVLHREVIPGLSLLYGGRPRPEPEVVLDGERFGGLADACLRDFDCTLFDTAPANRSTDALTVSSRVGYALLVARRGKSFTEDLGFLADQMRQDSVTVIGSVFNGV